MASTIYEVITTTGQSKGLFSDQGEAQAVATALEANLEERTLYATQAEYDTAVRDALVASARRKLTAAEYDAIEEKYEADRPA